MFHEETARKWGVLGLFVSLALCLGSPALALTDTQLVDQAIEDNDLTEHYRIEETTIEPARLLAPSDLLRAEFDSLKKAGRKVMSLVRWLKLNGPLDPPPERYNRRRQFGTWRRDPTSGSCMDARATVLARDSLVPVTTRPSSSGRCVVASGRWIDPYNGREFTVGSEVSIDHMVPLKNAYLAGGWRWDKQKRCQYFNFYDSPDHLLSVSGRENSSKGDSSPADYMPPIRSYQCQYLKSWLSVKAVWGLAMSGEEAGAIRDEIHQLGCKEDDLRLTSDEITALRARILKGTPACPAPRPETEERLVSTFAPDESEY